MPSESVLKDKLASLKESVRKIAKPDSRPTASVPPPLQLPLRPIQQVVQRAAATQQPNLKQQTEAAAKVVSSAEKLCLNTDERFSASLVQSQCVVAGLHQLAHPPEGGETVVAVNATLILESAKVLARALKAKVGEDNRITFEKDWGSVPEMTDEVYRISLGPIAREVEHWESRVAEIYGQ